MAGRFFLASASVLGTVALLVVRATTTPCSALSTQPNKRGFGAETQRPQQTPKTIPGRNDAAAEQIARSLFGVCSHLQNPDLYVPSWADACAVRDTDGALVASRDIARGDIVSLYPIHSLGLRGDKNKSKNKNKNKNKPIKTKNRKGTPKSKPKPKSKSGSTRSSDYLVYDADRDGAFFGSSRRTTNYCIDFPAMTDRPELRGQSLFLDANPDRANVPGWLGHLCGRSPSDSSNAAANANDNANANANCAAIPVEGAVPLVMVVATREIPGGAELVRDVATNRGEAIVRDRITQSGKLAMGKYAVPIAELKGFTDMVYGVQTENGSTEDEDDKAANAETIDPSARKSINLDYPGLVEFHSDPDVYAVDQFLSADECDRIVAKCEPHTAPCVVVTDELEVGPDDRTRTSTEAILPRAEAPTIVAKLTELLECSEDQLEILQVLRYQTGQEFKPHTDGFDGPVTASGFRNSGRLVTVFVYLNDVRRGGHTEFPELGFTVAPKKGSAIVHFPASVGLEEDPRTVHRGMPAIDEKWLLATWVWKHERTDEAYAESRLPTLGRDVI
eukprot:CAMPEP_0172363298 /NCGR_PEP_ID=MMETSP1060-20121228/6702_1 /TAXON_ID=37318 /ORGANISM="Pseudo-nitzschia pungens, Strain cf. cingulata" /LENGTH=560 /DNA_ID=CAMNT_0013086019 /DNA_START=126 /DNA_END=1808 /DNA_ORIENTATION=-